MSKSIAIVHYFCFLLFYLICFSTLGQSQYKSFSGVILHPSDETPVDDVNIYFEDTAIGTISNENGKFELHYNLNKLNDYLIISKIGYATLRLKFSEIPKNSPIYLSRESVLLDEVVITLDKIKQTPEEIVEIAFQNLTKNLSPSAYLSTGYIRHTERTKNKYRYLKEAIFTLYDPGLNTDPSEISLNINYSRNTIDNREIDTVRFYTNYLEATNLKASRKNRKKALNYKNEDPVELEKAIAFYDNYYTSGYHKKYGLIKKIFATDINKIRYFGAKKSTFSKKTLNDFSFKIDTIFGFKSDLVYKIKFSKKEKEKIDIGYLFINRKDYAIIEVQYSRVLSKNHHYRKFSGLKILDVTTIKYRKIKGYYYPTYTSYKRAKFNNKLLKSIIEKNQNQFNYYSHQEILLSNVVTEKSIIKEVINKQKYWNDNLFQDINNDDGWEGKNFLLESSYEEKLRKDLEIKSLKKSKK